MLTDLKASTTEEKSMQIIRVQKKDRKQEARENNVLCEQTLI